MRKQRQLLNILVFSLVILSLSIPLFPIPSHGFEKDRQVREKGTWHRGRMGNPENLERWRKLPPARKRRLIKRYRRWEKLPPRKRQMILRRYRKFKNLSPGEQKRLRNRWRKLKHLSPIERKSLRSFVRKFRGLPRGKKIFLKKEVRALRKLPPGRRRSVFMSLEDLNGFTREEKLAFYRFTLEKWKSE